VPEEGDEAARHATIGTCGQPFDSAHQTKCKILHFGASLCNTKLLGSRESENEKTSMNRAETTINMEENNTAGDGIRTHDVQLGKLAFYH
jgi:hypothetical protein